MNLDWDSCQWGWYFRATAWASGRNKSCRFEPNDSGPHSGFRIQNRSSKSCASQKCFFGSIGRGPKEIFAHCEKASGVNSGGDRVGLALATPEKILTVEIALGPLPMDAEKRLRAGRAVPVHHDCVVQWGMNRTPRSRTPIRLVVFGKVSSDLPQIRKPRCGRCSAARGSRIQGAVKLFLETRLFFFFFL